MEETFLEHFVGNIPYLSVYLTICALTALYSIVILTKLSSDIASEMQIYYFRNVIISLLVFIATEVVYAFGNFGFMPFSATAAGLTNALGMLMIALACYYWFMYAEQILGLRALNESGTVRFIAKLPLFVMAVLYVASLWTGWIFDTSGGVSTHGPLYFIPPIVDNIYLVFVTIHALVLSANEKSAAKRKEYLLLITFVISPSIAGILDGFVPYTPIMMLGAFTSIYLVFINTQESRIYNDALTTLNNRRSADNKLEQMLGEVSPEKPFYLFLMDIDKFKQINDTYGHVEGDRALQIAGAALKKVSDEHLGAFSARWGGDEFIFLVWENAITSPDAFMQNIHQAMWELRKEHHITYELTMSIGYAKCTSPSTSSSALERDADAMLYRGKQEIHEHEEEQKALDNVTRLR